MNKVACSTIDASRCAARRCSTRSSRTGNFCWKLSDPAHPRPRVINTGKACLYDSAIAAVKVEGTLHRRCRHRPLHYFNNILELEIIERSNDE